MKLLKINKKIILTVFCTITLILILENPSISQINIYYNYISVSETQPQLNDGFFIQGSSFITQNTITYMNQTSNSPIGYKSELSIFNFGSLFICFVPLFVYLCSDNNFQKNKIKTKKENKK